MIRLIASSLWVLVSSYCYANFQITRHQCLRLYVKKPYRLRNLSKSETCDISPGFFLAPFNSKKSPLVQYICKLNRKPQIT